MSWIIPAIMALGKGAAAAGTAAAGAAGTSGAAGGAAAAGAGSGAGAAAGAAGAGLAGAGNLVGDATDAAGAAPKGAMMNFVKSQAQPVLKDTAKQVTKAVMNGAGQNSSVPNSQPGERTENPIPQFPGFGGSENGVPSAIMPGAMDNPFGSPGVRALNSTFSKGGGD